MGGGTVRDLLLDRNVFWVVDQAYLIAALGTGLITFFVARSFRVPPRLCGAEPNGAQCFVGSRR